MKINKDYVYRNIAGEQLLIPIGNTEDKSGLFVLTEIGGIIWNMLSEDKNEDEIISYLLSFYDAGEEEIKKDFDEFTLKLREKGLITE